MATVKEVKEKIVGDYKTHGTDTGSSQVQVALLTQRINELTAHFKIHKKDNNSRRGLLIMVSRRRKLLDYLKRTNINEYHEIIKKLLAKSDEAATQDAAWLLFDQALLLEGVPLKDPATFVQRLNRVLNQSI